MSKLVKTAEEQIVSSVTAAIKSNIADGTFVETEIPDFKTEIPADRKNGDYPQTARFCFQRLCVCPREKLPNIFLKKSTLKILFSNPVRLQVPDSSISI